MKTYLLIFHETKGALSIKATSVMFASIVIHFQDITIVANKVFSRQKHKPKNQNSQIKFTQLHLCKRKWAFMHSANDLLAHMRNRRLTPNCSIRFTAYLLTNGKHGGACQTAKNILTTSSLAATAILLTFILSSQYLSFLTLKNGQHSLCKQFLRIYSKKKVLTKTAQPRLSPP